MKKKDLRLISLTIACCGLLFIGSGVAMNMHDTTVIETTYSLGVYQNKVSESKTNEIILNDMTIEVNNPISVDVRDYLKDVQNIDSNVLNSLKLDTSYVNINEAGTYTYTISYKKKKYNGTFIVTEKELPKVTLTLRNLTLKKDSPLETTLSTYIVEELTDEIKNNIVLDLSNVKTNIEGTYQYSVTYNNKIYLANIEIYTPQAPTIITPNSTEQIKDTTNTDTNTSTEVDNQTTTDNTTSIENDTTEEK